MVLVAGWPTAGGAVVFVPRAARRQIGESLGPMDRSDSPVV